MWNVAQQTFEVWFPWIYFSFVIAIWNCQRIAIFQVLNDIFEQTRFILGGLFDVVWIHLFIILQDLLNGFYDLNFLWVRT